MRILAVDDERIMLDGLVRCIRDAAPDGEIIQFRHSLKALEYCRENPVDVAFLDIKMPGMNGLALGKELLSIYPDINIIYCTAYDEYVWDAFRDVRCNGYILKPADKEQVVKELNHLRIPMRDTSKKRVRMRCFGKFEMFVDDRPVEFESFKTKELVAYLVDKCGAMSGNQEIIAVLWDDDDRHDSYFKKLRKDMLSTLEQYDCADIIWRQRGSLGIDPDKVECDLYDWKKEHKEKYDGDYMTQYDWANIPEYEW